MSTAEATQEDGPHEAEGPSRSHVPPDSPGLAAAWLLRAASLAAIVAGATGLIVAPGVRGNAGERVVVWTDRVSALTAYFLVGLLVSLVLWGALELVRSRGVGVLARVALIGSGAAVVFMSAPGLRERLPQGLAVLVSAGAAVAAIAGAYASARAPHTRAVAAILFAFAFAAITRLGAFELAHEAGERASVELYKWSRGLASVGVVFEAMGQFVAVTWLWTRGKLWGQVGTTAALACAVLLMWGVRDGAHSDAYLWQAVVHTALADGPGIPTPLWKLADFAIFLVPSSLLLGLVAAAQPKQVVAVVATVALVLVSRGAFDAPLRALCAVVAAQWAVLACSDERAMWRTLIDDRKRRLAEEAPP
jgi:hypothetical protein